MQLSAVRVECRRMDGGFGGKETQAGHLAAWAAKKVGQAIKLRLNRDDDFMVIGKRHPFEYEYTAGFDATGRLTALQLMMAANCSFSADLSGPVADRAIFHGDEPLADGRGKRDTTHYQMPVEDNILQPLITTLEQSSKYRARRADIERKYANSSVLKRGIALTPVKFGISFTATLFNQAGALVHVYTDGSVRVNQAAPRWPSAHSPAKAKC